MGQCECGHEHSGKFCPECGKPGSSSSGVEGANRSGESSNSNEGASDDAKLAKDRTAVSNESAQTGQPEKPEAPEATRKVRSRSGPRVVRVTTKKPEPTTGKTQSVSTRKIVKKPLPSKTGRGKTPSVRTRVVANIEKKQANEEKDKKSASGNSMRDKIRHASGWRWM